MRLRIRTVNQLTQKLKLTSYMRLSLQILQLPIVKLREFINQQAEENPLLNLEYSNCFQKKNYGFDDEEKQNYKNNLPTNPITLHEYLLKQLRIQANSGAKYKIGELIISNIDDNGYLQCSVEDIAKSANVPLPKVEQILSLIHTFDPPGVGARNLSECLMLQLKAKGKEGSLATQLLDKYFDFLTGRKYRDIAKKLSTRGGSAYGGKISLEKIKEAVQEISHLEPKPGRSFGTEKTVYLKTDLILKENGKEYEIMFNNWELPRINLNNKYRVMLRQKNIPRDTKEYLRERLKAARSLIIAISNHKNTLKEIAKNIIYFQKDFLDEGAAGLKPLTLREIAIKVGKHKSTVSRAISNKYIQTPNGIHELRYFLNSGIKQENGKFISSKATKSRLKEIILNENKEKPLSDQRISRCFTQEGIFISRRTITKYRNRLKMPPSNLRRLPW